MFRLGSMPTADDWEAIAVWGSKIIVAARFYDIALGASEKLSVSPTKVGPEGKGWKMALVDPTYLALHYLKMLRGQALFHSLLQPVPLSFFFFHIKCPDGREDQFSYELFPDLAAFYLRIRHWGLLFRSDGGYIAQFGTHFFEKFLTKDLAPIQLTELAAHFFTMARCQRRSLEAIISRTKSGGRELIELDLTTLPPRRAFDDDKGGRFLKFFLACLNHMEPSELQDLEEFGSYLTDGDGNILDVDPNTLAIRSRK
jgi:hypothetical protein